MTDETRETLTKMRDRREGIISAGFFTSREACLKEAAALRDVLTPRTCSMCKHWRASDSQWCMWWDHSTSADDGCIRGWQAREGEEGTR